MNRPVLLNNFNGKKEVTCSLSLHHHLICFAKNACRCYLLTTCLLLVILTMSACGKKGPPVPRDEVLTRQAENELNKPASQNKTVVETNIDTTDSTEVKDNQ